MRLVGDLEDFGFDPVGTDGSLERSAVDAAFGDGDV
jgi:hypothetical protein